jgi:hypothetical protein
MTACQALRTAAAAALLSAATPGAAGTLRIAHANDATPMERLAAREVRRYFYLRTGTLAQLEEAAAAPGGPAVFVAGRDSPALPEALRGAAATLGPQDYLLRTEPEGGRAVVWIVGGGGPGALYGAYRFAERLGVRFYLHGDAIPDARAPAVLPSMVETGRPLFEVRGCLPFHDFPEGPDWWSADDYLAYVSQLAKLRMNFIGLHAYPEGDHGPEPLV